MPYTDQYPEIKKLLDGYQKFRNEYFIPNKALYKHWEKYGQSPKIIVISCCDSRVDPGVLTQSNPGSLFTIRNIANLVPDYHDSEHCLSVSAGLEFAVCHLEVSHILILGHRYCGGIRALLQYDPENKPKNFIERWIIPALPARAETLQQYAHRSEIEQLEDCEQRTLLLSLNNLSSFPWIKQRVEKKLLHLHAWYHDLDSGNMQGYSQVMKKFVRLV